MQITELATAPSRHDDGGNVREGAQDTKVMLTSAPDSPIVYKIAFMRTITEYYAPRHRHDIDQLQFILHGEMAYAKDKVLSAGEIGYFPEGAYYGPQIRVPGMIALQCLFTGASGRAYITPQKRKAAIDEMSRLGKFERGVYTYIDEGGQKHNQDASEAVWERVTGRKLEYPSPRYAHPIAMMPEHFRWIDSRDEPGVAYKWLASFTERQMRVGFIRLQPGATWKAQPDFDPQILFVTAGAIKLAGKSYSLHTAFGFRPSDGVVSLQAEQETEALCVQFPTQEIAVSDAPATDKSREMTPTHRAVADQ